MLSNAGGDTLVVYTDVEDSSGVTFASRYSSTSSPTSGTTFNVSRDSAGAGTTVVADVVAGSIKWSEAKRDDATTSTTTMTVNNAQVTTTTFRGSVLDAPGTFSCVGATGCTAPTADATTGALSGAVGTWSFAPDGGALAQIGDTAYIALGWWLNKIDADTYSYRDFAMARGASLPAYDTDADATNGSGVPGSQIAGSATYTGGAAGKYAFLNEVLDEASAGHWTATATMTANFDADIDGTVTDGANPNDMGGVSVSGTISNFVTDTGPEAGWMVRLAASDGVPDVDGTDSTIGMQGYPNADPVTNAGVATWSRGSDAAAKGVGTWSYAFHGAHGTVASVSSQPAAITGEFAAQIGSAAYITGAYGAQKDEDE